MLVGKGGEVAVDVDPYGNATEKILKPFGLSS
jgi:hypothetical protein